ncbi:MFS transporter [Campylobacter sp. VicNov18]|uniref:MFS transporter n=1 Tax=Campylobacter bilis TaxID=2691918 RepID=UPI00130E3ACA|nr:MFS transporter [Campylobacter bilis]MPV63800.1 MFS transporter [Campylobacter hepaticus]MBM0637301.1 MFS transporter [Campylobacter bilis]MCC8278020.1 MFS transporter [Campylobacter bilis]MCC8299524.1 MFS transporter [Campylobacter bilis]MCC8300929.1 MFS transporter [Campylobacter bilis]
MKKISLKTQEFKVLGLSSLGGTLEFYDFIIFVFFTQYIASAFFPKGIGEFWALLNTYGVFAIGYLVRPLGGIVMAHFGDKLGRKNMFMLSILLMVIPTFALAFIPGYETLGVLAPILLILIRIFQGIAIGGELPGAWVFVREHCQENQKALFLSCLNSAMALGILLGSVVFLLINAFFTPEQIAAYAWRIAFFLGGIFGIISVYLRKFLQETPVFKHMQKESSLSSFPLRDLFKEKNIFKALFSSMLMTWVLTGCVVVLVLLMPKFMPGILNLSPIEGSYLQILGILGIGLGGVFIGYLVDRFGLFKICVLLSLAFVLFSCLYFYALYELKNLILVCILYTSVCFLAGINVFAPILMSEVFRAKIRFSGISFSYNIAYAISGGITPQLVFWLHTLAIQNENPFLYGMSMYMIFLAFCAIFAVFVVKDQIKLANHF